MKIVIIGSKGFLGTKAKEILSKNHEIIEAGRSNDGEFQLDATKKEEVRKFLLKHQPDVVLDTVALTSSTQCENNPKLAEDLNYLTAKNISEVCHEIGATMVFMSSAYLFDGEKGNYNENDRTSPINEYARTKIMAEKEVLKNPKSITLRVDVMYGYNGKGKKNQTGIFHLAGPDRTMMIDFLKNLESLVRNNSIISVGSTNSSVEIKIPKNATFDTSKVENLGIKFTSFKDGLENMKRKLAEN